MSTTTNQNQQQQNSSSVKQQPPLSFSQKMGFLFGLVLAFMFGFLSGSVTSSTTLDAQHHQMCSSSSSSSALANRQQQVAAAANNNNKFLVMPNDELPSEEQQQQSNTNEKNNNNNEMKKFAGVKNGQIDEKVEKNNNKRSGENNGGNNENDSNAVTIAPMNDLLPYRKPALCPAHRRIQSILTRFIDIDFIEFVTSSCPDPSKAMVLDIGLFHGGEVAKMAKQGFNVIGFEPNPVRFNFCKKEIDELKPNVRNRVELHNAAVSDQSDPLYFQLAGVDSHAYFVEAGGPTKIKTIVVPSTPISTVFKKHRNFYFVKVDTQGFDTRIVESMVTAMEQYNATAEFIQFEFSPFFEVTRSKRTKEEHKRFFRVLQDAGYDIFMGAAVQPWTKSMRGTYGKTPLSMICPEHKGIPTCIDDFVEYMHASKERAIRPGKTSTDFGSWMDLLAVRRSHTSPYWRHTGWVLARKM